MFKGKKEEVVDDDFWDIEDTKLSFTLLGLLLFFILFMVSVYLIVWG